MKNTIAISLGLFAIIFTSILTAGLVTYQNKKDAQGGRTVNVLDSASTTGAVTQISLDAGVVATHATEADCWMTIGGKVYDITAYFGKHPGGDKNLLNFCGKDATQAFANQGHSDFARKLLGDFLVGDIGSMISVAGASAIDTVAKPAPQTTTVRPATTKPKTTTTTSVLDSTQVASHDTQADCWMTIGGKVYNITSYFGQHPGGDKRLLNYCGKDATQAFEGQGHSDFAHQLLADFLVGAIGASVTVTDAPSPMVAPKTVKNDDDEEDD